MHDILSVKGMQITEPKRRENISLICFLPCTFLYFLFSLWLLYITFNNIYKQWSLFMKKFNGTRNNNTFKFRLNNLSHTINDPT